MNYTLKQNINEIYAILQKAKSCLKRNLFWKKKVRNPKHALYSEEAFVRFQDFFSTIAMHLNS